MRFFVLQTVTAYYLSFRNAYQQHSEMFRDWYSERQNLSQLGRTCRGTPLKGMSYGHGDLATQIANLVGWLVNLRRYVARMLKLIRRTLPKVSYRPAKS